MIQRYTKMLLSYIKDRVKYLAMMVIFFVVFSVLSYLYGTPVDGAIYGVIICISVCVIVGIIGFVRYSKKEIELITLTKTITHGDIELPVPTSEQERNYQALLIALHDEFNNIVTQNNLLYSEMKDFYSLWVHQIKTPISAMSLIIQEDESERGRQLKIELFKVEQYTELVLNFLRIEDISSDLSLSYFNLLDIVKQAVKKYAPIFINKNISVELKDLDVLVLTDDKWLTFVVEQVLSNALKYTKKNGAVKICIEDKTTLVVQDNGIGISLEDLPRIFEKGFTGYNGRMHKKATGIGLYLTKKTLDKLGHTIQISSLEGSGTIVRIDLSSESMTFE